MGSRHWGVDALWEGSFCLPRGDRSPPPWPVTLALTTPPGCLLAWKFAEGIGLGIHGEFRCREEARSCWGPGQTPPRLTQLPPKTPSSGQRGPPHLPSLGEGLLGHPCRPLLSVEPVLSVPRPSAKSCLSRKYSSKYIMPLT